MKLVQANEASKEYVDQFFINNETVDQDRLLKEGYVVISKEKIIGCFILELVKTDVYWLRQLYITQAEAAILPLLLESILTLAKHEQAKEVCVNSHQPMVDIILEALQFQPNTKKVPSNGKWWTYNVC